MEYTKFRWFYTKSKKLVVGGKSAEQNDFLLTQLKKENGNYLVMHTASPGSPFSILYDSKKPSENDIKEMAIFTVSFSQLWKQKKKSGKVHIFNLNQLNKPSGLKTGTWNVSGKVREILAPLRLTLTRQEEKLRAVPYLSISENKLELTIVPGSLDKSNALTKIKALFDESVNQEEVIQALPAGGIRII